MTAGQNLQTLGFAYTGDAAVRQYEAALNRATAANAKFVSSTAQFNQQGTLVGRTVQQQIDATTKLSTTYRNVGGNLQVVNSRLTEQADAVNTLTLTWRSLARIVAAQVIYQAIFSITSAIRESVAEAGELQKRVAEIRTISQNTPRGFGIWADELREVSDSFGLDILDTAESAYQALSNQVVDAAEAQAFLIESSRFAITALATQADSVNLLSSAINAFQLDVADTDAIAASFFKTIELGRVRAEELSQSYGRIAVAANQLNIQLDELNAFIAVTTRQGLKYSETATQIRGVLTALIKPTTAMKDLFAELGVESGEAAIETFGLLGVIEKIAEATGNQSQEVAKLVPRIRGLSGILAVARNSGLEYAQTYDEIIKAQEDYANAATIQLETPAKQLEIQLNRVRNFFVRDIGQTAISTITTLIEYFGDLDTAVEALVYTVGALAAGLAAAGLVAALSTPIGIAAVAAGALFVQINRVRSEYPRALREIAKEYDALQAAAEASIKAQTDTILRANQAQVRADLQKIATIRANWNQLAQNIDDNIKAITEDLDKNLGDVTKLFDAGLKQVNDRIKNTKDQVRDLAKFTEDFAANINERIFREGLAGQNVSQQIASITRQIISVEEQRRQAVAAGNQQLSQSLLNDQRDLVAERIKLDRERVNRLQKLNEEQVTTQIEIEQRLKSERETLRRAIATADGRAATTAKRNIREILDEQIKANEQFARERRIVDTTTTGEFANNYEREYKNLIEIAKQQEEELTQTRLRELDKLAAYQKRVLLEVSLYRQRLQQFEEFDLNDQIKNADPNQIDAIIRTRAAQISELQQSINRIADQETRLRVASQLEQLEANEQARIAVTLEQRKVNLLEDQRKAIGEIADQQIKAASEELQQQSQTLIENNRLIAEYGALLNKAGGIRTPGIQNIIDTATAGGDLTDEQVTKFQQYLKFREESLIKSVQERSAVQSVVDNFDELINKNVDLQRRLEAQANLREQYNRSLEASARVEEESKRILEATRAEAARQQELRASGLATEKERAKTVKELLDDMRAISLELQKQKQLQSNVVVDTVTSAGRQATGGPITRGRDSIHALLQPGEFVMNANASRKFYSQLVAMNADTRRFSTGGSVTNVGDVNVNMTSSGNEAYDVHKLGKMIQRGIRQKVIKLR